MTATVRLYELANAADILDEFLSESEGELTPELEQLLEELEGQITEKVERVALYIRQQLVTVSAIKEEESRLAARRRSLERAVEGLKNYLKRQLERLGKEKVQGLLCTVAIQKNSTPSVQLSVTPEQFHRIPGGDTYVKRVEHVDYIVDTAAILATWRHGTGLPPAITVTQGTHLRIR